MKLTYELAAELLDRGVWQSVSAMQYDANTRAVEVTLTAGGVAWTPPKGTAVSVAFKKPDGKKGWYDKLPDGSDACSVSGNVVTAVLAPEVLTAAGEVRAAIVFQDSNLNQLATFGFSVLVEANPAAGTSVSNNYYKYSTMEQVSAAMEELLDALDQTKEDMEQLVEQQTSSSIVCETAGEEIYVTDSDERSLRGLNLYGKTVQVGAPSLDAPAWLLNAGEVLSDGSGGSISVMLAGKNLCDAKSVSNDGYNNTSVSVSDDGYEIISRGSKPYASSLILISPEGLRGKQLYLKVDSFESTKDYDCGVLCECRLSDGGGAWPGSIYKGKFQTSFVVPENATLILIELCANHSEEELAEDNTLTVKGLMLSMGGYAPWEQYRPIQTLTAPTPGGLSGVPVSSGGNYTDGNGQRWICDEIDFARGVRIKRTGGGWITSGCTVVSTGPMSSAKTYYRTQINIPASWGESIAYKYGTTDGLFSHGSYLHAYTGSKTYGYVHGKTIVLSLPASCGTTVEEVKAYIAQQEQNVTPLLIRYPLATPVETPIPEEALAVYRALCTRKPNTTVYNDAGIEQKLAYAADTKLYIDNKFNELAAAIVSNT